MIVVGTSFSLISQRSFFPVSEVLQFVMTSLVEVLPISKKEAMT